MDAFPLTNLPLDLARKVLEDAALVNKAECLAILRVSRLAHEWLEPILYRQVFLREPRETTRFAYAITLRNNPSFFASRVKSLFLNQTSVIASDVALILQVCTGLHRLTIRGPSNGSRPNLSFEAFTRDMKTLRYLALPLGRIPNTNFCAVQSNVTHLTLESGKFGGFLDILEMWREVCLRCTELTHVAFSMLAYPDDFARADFSTYIERISLAMPSSIEMVVMMIWAVHQVETARSLERDLAETAKNDPRFVFVTYDIAKRPSIPVQGLGLRSHTEKSENWGYLFNESEPDYLWTFAEHTRKTRDGMRT